MAVLDVQAENTGGATTLQVSSGDQLVLAEPDAVQWCLTFWRSMQIVSAGRRGIWRWKPSAGTASWRA